MRSSSRWTGRWCPWSGGSGREPGERVRAEDLSYFSRLADAEGFTREALYETHRRGTGTADVVVAVSDGAVWEQGFLDYRRIDAVRILDFYHASGYLSLAAQAAYGPGTRECAEWVERWRHELRHGEPEAVLREGCRGEAGAIVGAGLGYLRKRGEQIRYAEFELMGLPIGSGIVESANKLLVEERLKGSGMHWARENVSPMLALRTIAFNDRWGEAWPQIVARLRAQRAEAARARRRAEAATVADPPVPIRGPLAAAAGLAPSAPTERPGKPAPDHPWRRSPIGRNRRPAPAPAT